MRMHGTEYFKLTAWGLQGSLLGQQEAQSVLLNTCIQYRAALTAVRKATVVINFTLFLIFVVPSIMLYSSEIGPTRCNNCVFILRNGFTLHVSGDNLTHHQEYICCIWPQVSRLT